MIRDLFNRPRRERAERRKAVQRLLKLAKTHPHKVLIRSAEGRRFAFTELPATGIEAEETIGE